MKTANSLLMPIPLRVSTLRVSSALWSLVLLVALLIVTSAEGEEKSFALAIANRRLASPEKVIRVSQGDTVHIRWTTDETAELHLHGYDLETVVKPGAPASLEFKAHVTGRFPITLHGSGEPGHGSNHSHGSGHGHGEVILIYLEVLPR